METGIQLLNSTVGFFQQNALAGALVFVFASAVLLVLGGSWMLSGRTAVQRRLDQDKSKASRKKARPRLSIRYDDENFKFLNLFKPIYEPFVPKEQNFYGTVKRQLIQAGYMHPSAVSRFYGVRIVGAIALGVGALVLSPIVLGNLDPDKVLAMGVIFGLAGYFLPAVYVSRRRSTRQRLIREGFPDALDLLMVCVEAGQGLDASIAHVGAEIGKAHPHLAHHFMLVGVELRAGRSRREALKSLGERTGVEDVRSLVSLLIQSDELGTSVATALRVHAFEMRATRILRAEEMAHKIPVKLAFPLMLGLIPVVLMVTLTPAIIKMVAFLVPALAGGTTLGGATDMLGN